MNTKTTIQNDFDLAELITEFSDINQDKLIEKHFVHAEGSNLRIQKFLAMEIYVSKFDFSGFNNK